MSRYAIGYASDLAQSPAVVFVEAPTGVWMLQRGGPAPRIFDRPLPVSDSDTVASPGEGSYFDVVLDSFSTTWKIRTVAELDPPNMISAMLRQGGEAWEALPRGRSGR